jgi:hypothetical protein
MFYKGIYDNMVMKGDDSGLLARLEAGESSLYGGLT